MNSDDDSLDEDLKRTLENSKKETFRKTHLTDVEREKEEEEELRRALELSKAEYGYAAGQISDDEDSEKSHKFKHFLQTPTSPALFADISTPKGDMSVDSLDDAKSKINEDSLSKIEMALKYCRLPSKSDQNSVDWNTKMGESRKDTTDRICREYRRYYSSINDQRHSSVEDTTWIVYKEGEVLGSKKRNVIQGQLATWFYEYYANGVPDDAKQFLALRRKRLHGKRDQQSIPVAVPESSMQFDPNPNLDIIMSDFKIDSYKSTPSSSQSPTVLKWSQVVSSNRIESDSSPNVSNLGQDSIITPTRPTVSIAIGRGTFPVCDQQAPTPVHAGRGFVTHIGRTSTDFRPPCAFGRGQRNSNHKTLYDEDDPEDFLQIKNQLEDAEDPDVYKFQADSDEEFTPTGQKTAKKKTASKSTAVKPRAAKATTEKKNGK